MTPLLQKLIRIPHLNLGLKLDIARMRDDISKIGEYRAYQTRDGNDEHRKHYADAWSGVSLSSPSGGAYDDMSEEIRSKDNRETKPTEYATVCPYLYEIASKLKGDRIRVMRISPKSRLSWHSHSRTYKQDPGALTVQIPIVLPAGFTYVVRDDAGVEYPATYEVGQAYIFNSYYDHNVFNPSDQYRTTLMFYVASLTPAVNKLLNDALERYDGVTIP